MMSRQPWMSSGGGVWFPAMCTFIHNILSSYRSADISDKDDEKDGITLHIFRACLDTVLPGELQGTELTANRLMYLC